MVTGAAGAIGGGVFSFALLPNMNDVITNTNGATAWLYTLTFLSFLVLLILVTGFVLLQRDSEQGSQVRPNWIAWTGLALFGLVLLTGLSTIVYFVFKDPTVEVQARLGSDSDLSSLEKNLSAHFDIDPDHPLQASFDSKHPYRYSMRESQAVVIEISNFEQLKENYADYKKQAADLQNQLKTIGSSGDAYLALAEKACARVSSSDPISLECALVRDALKS